MPTLTSFAAYPFIILALNGRAVAFLGMRPHSVVHAPNVATFYYTNAMTENVKETWGRRGRDVDAGRLSMLSSALKNEDDGTDVLDKKIRGRKNRVVRGYEAMLVSYVAQALFSARAGASSIVPIAGYIVPPAVISYVMISAATHDRLDSDTYKRLNLALLEYGLIGLLVLALSGGIKRPVRVLPFALTVVNSIKGYAYGVLGWNKDRSNVTLLGDLTKGIKTTAMGFFSRPKNFKAVGYMAASITVASLKLLKLKEIVEVLLSNSPLSGGDFATIVARFNRLAFLTMMSYTLRDAADRDRLGGTTFVHMNYLCALSMAVHCFYFSGGGIATPVGALSAIFGVFFAFNGISSSMNKR
jgi:hypothetical protein